MKLYGLLPLMSTTQYLLFNIIAVTAFVEKCAEIELWNEFCFYKVKSKWQRPVAVNGLTAARYNRLSTTAMTS